MKDDRIKEMIDVYPEDGLLPCAVAHFIAAYLNVEPEEVGRVATETKSRLYQCQLGLFGFGRKGKSGYKITGRKVEVSQDVLEAIKEKAVDGRITCVDLWDISRDSGIVRPEIGNAADSLGLKITPCQLGAFK